MSEDSSGVSPQLRYAWASMKASVVVAFVGLFFSVLYATPVHFTSAILTTPLIVGCMTLFGYVRGRWFDAA